MSGHFSGIAGVIIGIILSAFVIGFTAGALVVWLF